MNPNPNPRLELILGRRSIRVYAPGEISDAALEQLLKAAMAAPSAMTKDPWRFITIRNKATLAHLASILPGGKMLLTATAAVIVCGDQEAALEQQLSFLLQDCSAAIENLLLAAHALDLGACWVGIHPSADAIKKVRDLLALPAAVVPVAAVSLGLPGEQLPPRTRYRAQYVKQETWGA
ncbi:MAG TPA: nitroreductase family protein [Verrucomicrobiae bacterium]|nr:nitroreductase family protein [Verrucomicrobiae bacterium]